jgi:hypothetical protein
MILLQRRQVQYDVRPFPIIGLLAEGGCGLHWNSFIGTFNLRPRRKIN